MAIGSSIFLVAVGAILTFAVDATVAGLDIDVVGIILMIAGAVGVLMSLFVIERTAAPRESHTHTERTVVER